MDLEPDGPPWVLPSPDGVRVHAEVSLSAQSPPLKWEPWWLGTHSFVRPLSKLILGVMCIVLGNENKTAITCIFENLEMQLCTVSDDGKSWEEYKAG